MPRLRDRKRRFDVRHVPGKRDPKRIERLFIALWFPRGSTGEQDRQPRIVLGLDAGIGGELPRMCLALRFRRFLAFTFGELALFDSFVGLLSCQQCRTSARCFCSSLLRPVLPLCRRSLPP